MEKVLTNGNTVAISDISSGLILKIIARDTLATTSHSSRDSKFEFSLFGQTRESIRELASALLSMVDPPEPEPVTQPLTINIRQMGKGEDPYYTQKLPVKGGVIFVWKFIEHIRYRPETHSLIITTTDKTDCSSHGEDIDIE